VDPVPASSEVEIDFGVIGTLRQLVR